MKNIIPEAIHSERGSVRYLKELSEMSRRNRNNPTPAEDKLWREVLRKKKTGYLFLRQKPIHRFIVDFYCSKLSLAIEVDGGYHLEITERDKIRDRFLKSLGITTIRFSNKDILENIVMVRKRIMEEIRSLP